MTSGISQALKGEERPGFWVIFESNNCGTKPFLHCPKLGNIFFINSPANCVLRHFFCTCVVPSSFPSFRFSCASGRHQTHVHSQMLWQPRKRGGGGGGGNYGNKQQRHVRPSVHSTRTHSLQIPKRIVKRIEKGRRKTVSQKERRHWEKFGNEVWII